MRSAIAIVALGLAAALASCSGSDGPTGPGPEEDYVFEPAQRELEVPALEEVQLVVRSADGGDAVATFYVDGDSVAVGGRYAWPAVQLGTFELRARVVDGERIHEAVWTVRVSEEGAGPTPQVVTVTAGRGSEPGSIGLRWERPSLGWKFLQSYRVHYDTAALDPESLEGVPFVEVAQDTSVVLQRLLLDGLQEQTFYHLRVVAVDVLERTSPPSPEVTSMSTGHFDISGRVSRLADPEPGKLGVGIEDFPQVLVAIGPYRALTDAEGRYELRNLPDTMHEPLRIRPTIQPDVNSYYWLESDVRDTVDQTFDTVLFRRTPVRVDQAGTVESMDFLPFFFHLAAKTSAGTGNSILQRWESYPIPVRIDQLVLPHGADAGAALARAIETWNLAAGEELMTAHADGAPIPGADREVVDAPPVGGQILGEVRMIQPSSPTCLFQCIPEQVMVKFSDELVQQAVVDRVALHELGHVLWMTHSLSSDHVMDSGETGYSQTQPQWPELRVARLIKHLPNGTDLGWFVEPGAWED